MQHELQTIVQAHNLTRQYPFDAMAIGDCFTVFSHFQHCRVAASEYARKHNQVYSCRMQPSDETGQRSMKVYRVAGNQDQVDKRGRTGKRIIPTAQPAPTRNQFFGWLNTFSAGQSFLMPASYSASFQVMEAWSEVYSLKTGIKFRTALQPSGSLLISRVD